MSRYSNVSKTAKTFELEPRTRRLTDSNGGKMASRTLTKENVQWDRSDSTTKDLIMSLIWEWSDQCSTLYPILVF